MFFHLLLLNVKNDGIISLFLLIKFLVKFNQNFHKDSVKKILNSNILKIDKYRSIEMKLMTHKKIIYRRKLFFSFSKYLITLISLWQVHCNYFILVFIIAFILVWDLAFNIKKNTLTP